MTNASSQTPASATPDLTRWTGAKASHFLRLLARSGKVGPSARAVGMSRQSAYRLRARAPLFAQYWKLALEQAARHRAISRKRGKAGPVHPLLAAGRASLADAQGLPRGAA